MSGRLAALGVAAMVLLVPPASGSAAAVRSDFDGDGKADVLWRNETTGLFRVWLMNGSAIAADQGIDGEVDRFWRVQAAADFTGDGKADILWHHTLSGETRLWVMNKFAVTSRLVLPTLSDTD